jgi:uncharacterized protein
MTQPNQDLVRAASAAFGSGDLTALQEQYFDPSIVWHVAGTGPMAGDYEGVEQVMGQLSKVSELTSGSLQPQIHDVLVSDDHTVVLVTISAARAGKQIQMNLVHVIHAANGKATEVWTHSTDPAGAAQFWS